MSKNKLLGVRKDQRTFGKRPRGEREEMEDVLKFKYMSVTLSGDGERRAEMTYKLPMIPYEDPGAEH